MNTKEIEMSITNNNPPKLLTMAEYAGIMGLSTSKVKRLKLSGRIPFFQEGQIVRIPVEATDYEWLNHWQQDHGVPQ